MAFSNKDLVKELAKNTTSVVVGTAAGTGVDPTGVVTAFLAAGALAFKAGAYTKHRSTVSEFLGTCLEEYCTRGLLTKVTSTTGAKPSMWRTTRMFRDARLFLQIYPDIAQYIIDEKITDDELERLGMSSTVTIYAEKAVCKGLGSIIGRLSAACVLNDVRDITKTDVMKRITIISPIHIGSITLQNACIAEGQRRNSGEDAAIVPVLGRVLGLVAVCGINEIGLGDIIEILGKGPIFETVARSRLSKLRKSHASEVLNTIIFKGSTESAAKGFGELAIRFTGERVVVGHVKAARKSEFSQEYASFNCQLVGPEDKKHASGTPVYMMAGWARLIKQREELEREHSILTQMAHFHAPVKEKDIHGNAYMSAGKLTKVEFRVKELADGTLMAKPYSATVH